jgi:hypothetical protein
MNTLQRRVEALESKGSPAGIELIIIRKVVSSADPRKESQVARMGGQRYVRGPAETEEEFRSRLNMIASGLQAEGHGPVRMIISPFEEDL